MKPLLLIYFHVFPCPGGSFVPCLSDSIESNGGVLWSESIWDSWGCMPIKYMGLFVNMKAKL